MPAASEPAQHMQTTRATCKLRIATRAQVPALHMPNQNRRANPHSEPQQQGALPAQQGPNHTPRAATRIVGRAFMPAASEPAQHMQTTRATCKLRIATRAQVPALHMPNQNRRANPHPEPQQQRALPAQQGPNHTPRAATRIATRAQVPALQIPNQNRRANPPPPPNRNANRRAGIYARGF